MVCFEDLEIWDHIREYEGRYKVSSKGRVFSIRSNKILKHYITRHGYPRVNLCKDGECKEKKVHQLVANTFYFIDDTTGNEIDHIDGNKTNNNLLNLRFCSKSENQRNRGVQKNNTSGYKGVSWSEKDKKWIARIKVSRKRLFLGRFKDKEEAYRAYCEASKEFHKDFSNCP